MEIIELGMHVLKEVTYLLFKMYYIVNCQQISHLKEKYENIEGRFLKCI